MTVKSKSLRRAVTSSSPRVTVETAAHRDGGPGASERQAGRPHSAGWPCRGGATPLLPPVSRSLAESFPRDPSATKSLSAHARTSSTQAGKHWCTMTRQHKRTHAHCTRNVALLPARMQGHTDRDAPTR